MRRVMLSLWHDNRGAAAVEFALLAPAFLTMLIGTVMLAVMMFSNSALHFAVQSAARCASVKATVCTNAATTRAFAASNYFGATVTPTFTCTGRVCGGTAACGNKVSGQISFGFEVGMARYATPLRADACFP